MDLTVFTGNMGAEDRITIDWFDENNVHTKVPIDICILNQDKPRVLQIYINTRLAWDSRIGNGGAWEKLGDAHTALEKIWERVQPIVIDPKVVEIAGSYFRKYPIK